jgi:hypothetical protein
MLTKKEAREIVRNSVREVTGSVGNITAKQRLEALGIDSSSKLKGFKSAIAAAIRKSGYTIQVKKLVFRQDAAVAQVWDLVVLWASPAIEVRGSHVHARRALSAESKATIRRAFAAWAAKKKSAKKKTGHPKGSKKKAGKKLQWFLIRQPEVPRSGKARESASKKKAAKKSPKSKVAGRGGPADRFSDGAFEVRSLLSSRLPGDPTWKEPERRTGVLDHSERPPRRSTETLPTELPTTIVESIPQLEIRKELVPAKAYRMAVFVNQEPAAPGAEVQPLQISVPKDLEEIPVDVWLDCSSHFAVDDVADPPQIKIKTDTGVSDELTFTLKVLRPPDEKPMFVSAFFRYNGRPSGKITRYLELAGRGLRWKPFTPVVKQEGEEVVLPNAGALPSLALEANATLADIRVEVLTTEANDGRQFTLKCYTPQGEWEGAWTLPDVTKEFVKARMQNFMANKGDARIASLNGAGLDFWDALPREVKTLLWDALEKGARTISILTEEPYIPWELIVPYRDLSQPRQPLGLELQLGRWVNGNYKSARQRIPMKNGYVIRPKASGLTSAAQELAFLTQQLQPDFAPADEILPATFTGVNTGLGGPPRNVIHFICHGKTAILQTLELDKPDTLDSSQVRTLKGFITAFKDGPLAFLNACEVGGQVSALVGVGGFAASFIELGASAVVAPLWSVQDKVAFDVTQTFYPQALKGVPFAKIMQQIRAKAYSQAIDSYAAYCFYGDPLASTV